LKATYNGTTVSGEWILIGSGVSFTWERFPPSITLTPSLSLTTPAIFGNETSVLGGAFTSSSGNLVVGTGISYTNLFMGLGYGLLTDPFSQSNQAYGFDISAGEFMGVSIPTTSKKQKNSSNNP
jgi:hypothetical protein